jgi:hypothetical protein
MDNAAHLANIEKPAQFTQLLFDFNSMQAASSASANKRYQ